MATTKQVQALAAFHARHAPRQRYIKVIVGDALFAVVKRMDEMDDLTEAICVGDPGDTWRVEIVELTDREYARLTDLGGDE